MTSHYLFGVTPYNAVGGYQLVGKTYCFTLHCVLSLLRRWGQYVTPKR
jgi:hypothetical protein